MTKTEPTYPFVPKSNRHLRPGQFWALPVSGQRFGAGRVMAVPAFGPTDRIGAVIGLMDWIGGHPPTSEDLHDRQGLIQPKSRFEAIAKTGGEVLGHRPLELDGLEAIDRTISRLAPGTRYGGGPPSSSTQNSSPPATIRVRRPSR